MYTSITQILAIAFFALSLVSAMPTPATLELESRYVGTNSVMASIIARNPELLPSRDLSLRRHTESQIAAKAAKLARDTELETRVAEVAAKEVIRDLDAEVKSREVFHQAAKRSEGRIARRTAENLVREDDRLERRES